MMIRILIHFLLVFCTSLSMATEDKDPKLFILMDINNIIIDSVPYIHQKPDMAYSEKLQQLGFSVQHFEVPTPRSPDPKLDKFIKDTDQTPIKKTESNRLKVSEIFVIRPTIQSFIEAITELNIETYIIICSKNYNPRTRTIIENLNLQINNIIFKDLVDFIQKERSMVNITLPDGRKIPAKSAPQIRNQYVGKFSKIRPIDYLILIDQLPDSQFILSHREKDLNVQIPPFFIQKKYDRNLDIKELNLALKKIKKFINM